MLLSEILICSIVVYHIIAIVYHLFFRLMFRQWHITVTFSQLLPIMIKMNWYIVQQFGRDGMTRFKRFFAFRICSTNSSSLLIRWIVSLWNQHLFLTHFSSTRSMIDLIFCQQIRQLLFWSVRPFLLIS